MLALLTAFAACVTGLGSGQEDGQGQDSASDPFRFEEVSEQWGLIGYGPTFGAGAWGDFNGDGWPDLWLGNHATPNSLWINQTGVYMVDDAAQILLDQNPFADSHGAAWADFDGDGDQDLIELVGGGSGDGKPNQFFVNKQGHLLNRANLYNIAVAQTRGRTPLWVDWDGDNKLDLLTVNLFRNGLSSSVPMLQTTDTGGNPTFIMDQVASGFQWTRGSSEYAQLADLTDDGVPELIVDGGPFPDEIYDISQRPMVRRTALVFPNPIDNVADSVFADFNNDLLNDAYFSTDYVENASDAWVVAEHELRLRLLMNPGEQGVRIQAGENVRFNLPPGTPLSRIRLGASGIRPGLTDFELDPSDTRWHGIEPHMPGKDEGLYIGYDLNTQSWTILLSSSFRRDYSMRAFSTGSVRLEETINFDRSLLPDDELRIRQGQAFLSGMVDRPVTSRSVVAGDFDNDMDLDLYLVVSGSAANRGNVILENQGDGTFVRIDQPGSDDVHSGAAGTRDGVGDSVNMVDINRDGWLDLCVTNGQGDRFFAEDGPHELFLNKSATLHPTRHWLQVELVGPGQNLDAIGARVRVTVGGVTQQREQNGGMHRLGQSDRLLHFGLAEHDVIDSIEVLWPDGSTSVLTSVQADQILKIMHS